MSKTARHKAILDLLDEGPVESQDSLQHRLERKGFDVGQATLSRDIHELKLVKGPEGYRRNGGAWAPKAFCPRSCISRASLWSKSARPRTCWW